VAEGPDDDAEVPEVMEIPRALADAEATETAEAEEVGGGGALDDARELGRSRSRNAAIVFM